MESSGPENWWLRSWPLLVVVALQLTFLAWPAIDLYASALFYTSPEGFVLADSKLGNTLVAVVRGTPYLVVPLLVWLILASAYWGGRAEAGLRRRLGFIFLLLVLGPLLSANLISAESGRARPVDIEAFAGDRQLTPAFVPAAECRADCSFVSTPAAAAFAVIGLAWVFGARRWLVAGLLLGGVIGLVEVAAGRHFVSDVVFAFWLVYGIALLVARAMLGKTRITS